jgi:hypothetical protein
MEEKLRLIQSYEELNGMEMNGGGIIPFSYDSGNIYFLFGRESKDIRWSEKGLWSNFGGTINKTKESNIEGIVREFWEESSGIFGTKDSLENYIIENFNKLLIVFSPVYKGAVIFLPVNYDKNLPKYFNWNYLQSKMILNGKKELERVRQRGLLEKDSAMWFMVADLRKNKKKFRKCDYEVLDYICEKFTPVIEEKKETTD